MTQIRQGTVWKFKEGRGDKYRRLRVLHVQAKGEKTGPYVEVRSFYLNEVVWRGETDKRSNPHRQPKNIIIQQRTLLQNYECMTTLEREDVTSTELVAGFSSGMLR